MNSSPGVPANKTVWAFDLGIGSIGEAVRFGDKFLHKASLLIPAKFAETKTAAGRRRMSRTREAHKAREQWLDEVMQQAGIEPLKGRRTQKVDGKWQSVPESEAQKQNRELLEREFAKPGDPTCYTSCLLRIKLLRGEKLEPWQIYKALHSAIQKRGYGKVPWAAKEAARKGMTPDELEKKEKADLDKKDPAYKAAVEVWPQFKQGIADTDYHFPCYYDAAKMGLWNPAQPEKLQERITCQAQSTRQVRFERVDVEKEILALTEAAAKHYPKLKDQADYLLYGAAKTSYASYDAKLRKKHHLKEGGANDWQGVLGQKIPRFDNRIVGKCVVIPRMNVCKVDVRLDKKGNPIPETLLASEVSFLMKLKNMRIQRGKRTEGLNAKELKSVFENPDFQKLSVTESAWKKKVCLPLGAIPLPGHGVVDAPKFSGRSRFCRPALDILKRLILSGSPPKEFYKEEVARLNGNKNPLKGLVEDDLKFLLKMGETWEGIYIPNQKLDALVRNSDNKDDAIRTLIGSQNDPIVRHRLNLFVERLLELEEKFGEPESVVLEFVRTDFMGRKAKFEYNKFIKERAAERVKFRKEAEEVGASGRAGGLKMELLRAQGGRCLYTTAPLIPEELDEYVIDHIVPRTKGGPDAVVNYVLTTKKTNDDKFEQTPYEWLFGKEGWDAYVNRVRERAGALRNKKVQLLTSPDAETLVQKYTALAETAWISKLAQALLDLRFGWQNGNDKQGRKRVAVVSGGLTGRIRRKYKLNHILNPDAKDEEEAEKKNRSDDRHHALDAMVISFIPSWARDTKKTGFFKFPDGVNRELFEREIKEVIPQNVCFEKPTLAETIYGARGEGKDKIIVQRTEVISLAQKPTPPGKTKFDLEYARKQIKAIRDFHIQQRLSEFIATEPTEQAWKNFCQSFCLQRKDGLAGSLVKFVRVNVGEPIEYKDLSKDGTGAFRKALQGHKGQFVYADAKGKLRVRPVYAFESVKKVREELVQTVGQVAIKGFFQSGCLVEINQAITHAKTPLIPGKYILNTVLVDGRARMTDATGKQSERIPLSELFTAGFSRID